jgi:predicted MPP superfamily phosphohydrolase
MRLRNYAAISGIVMLTLGLWAFWLEPDSLRVRTYNLPLQKWPPAQTGLRVAVLADIHAGAPWIDDAKLQKICDLVNGAAPDLILYAGDLVMGENLFGHPMTPEHIAQRLSCLHAPLGVYAVLGNNDHIYGAAAIRQALAAHGVTVLDNQLQRIAQGPHQFWLAGLDDAWRGIAEIAPLLEKISDDAPVIVFTHEPITFLQIPSRVNLAIAGHTHGGQVRLPFLGRPALTYLGIAAFGAGHYVRQTDLFVSTGIGTSNLAVRFGVPPEISLLILRPAS